MSRLFFLRRQHQGRIQDSPRRGRRPSRRGRQHTNLPGFFKKLHEIKKILVRRGGRQEHHPFLTLRCFLCTSRSFFPHSLLRGGEDPPQTDEPLTESPLEGTWDQEQRVPEGTWDQAATQEVTSYRVSPPPWTE